MAGALRLCSAATMRMLSLMSVRRHTEKSTAFRRMRYPSETEPSSAFESRTLMTRSILPSERYSIVLGFDLEEGLCSRVTGSPRSL